MIIKSVSIALVLFVSLTACREESSNKRHHPSVEELKTVVTSADTKSEEKADQEKASIVEETPKAESTTPSTPDVPVPSIEPAPVAKPEQTAPQGEVQVVKPATEQALQECQVQQATQQLTTEECQIAAAVAQTAQQASL